MKVIVCGGRTFLNYDALERFMDMINAIWRISLVIHGDARGADTLAKVWANRHHIDQQPFPADWNKYHNGAGPIRNKQMLDEGKPELVIAFPGGRGTTDMRKQAHRAGVTVLNLANQKERLEVRRVYGDLSGRCSGGNSPP
jgi:hypothetical protein